MPYAELPLPMRVWRIFNDLLVGVPLKPKPPHPPINKVKRRELSGSRLHWFDFINGMTLCRFLTVIPLGLYYYSVRHNEIAMASIYVVIVILLGFTDVIDGPLARRHNVCSDTGNKLDHISDVVTFVTALAVIMALLGQVAFTGWADMVYRFTLEFMVVTIGIVAYVAWLNRDQRKDTDEGANNAGRRKYLIQGFGLIFFAIGITWFYQEPYSMAGLIAVGDIFLVLAFVPATVSINEYRERNLAKL